MSGSTKLTRSTVIAQVTKPGFKTSELTVAITGFAGALAALLGAFSVNSAIGNAIIKLGALIAAGITAYGYAKSRGASKTAAASLIGYTRDDTGFAVLVIIGLVLLAVGVVLLIAAAAAGDQHFGPYLPGVILAVVGLILLAVDTPGRTRL